MGKPESAIRKFRFILFALGVTSVGLSGVLSGCSSDSECDGADCEVSVVNSQAVNSGLDAENTANNHKHREYRSCFSSSQ